MDISLYFGQKKCLRLKKYIYCSIYKSGNIFIACGRTSTVLTTLFHLQLTHRFRGVISNVLTFSRQIYSTSNLLYLTPQSSPLLLNNTKFTKTLLLFWTELLPSLPTPAYHLLFWTPSFCPCIPVTACPAILLFCTGLVFQTLQTRRGAVVLKCFFFFLAHAADNTVLVLPRVQYVDSWNYLSQLKTALLETWNTLQAEA